MKIFSSWYDKPKMVNYLIRGIEADDVLDRPRLFNVQVDFYAMTSPGIMSRLPEDSEPGVSEAEFDPDSIIIFEDLGNGKEMDVTATIDQYTKSRIINKVDEWVQSQKAYQVWSEEAGDPTYEGNDESWE